MTQFLFIFQEKYAILVLMRRILLFIATNVVVVLTISIILQIFNIRPYLNQYGINYTELLLFCLIWGMGGALISLALSRTMAKMAMRVKVIDPNKATAREKDLYEMVLKLAKKAHLKAIPEVGIFPSEQFNAFATGPSQRKSLVAVSSGLLNNMAPGEIEAILGHEIAHIKNGDMVTMTLLQGIVNAFVMFLARVLAFALSSLGRGEDKRPSTGSYFLWTMLFQVVFMLLGSMIICAYSRRREFRADKGGAKLSSKNNMISALERLKPQRVSKATPSLQAFMISNPTKRSWRNLFATHPPLEDRINRLSQSN